MKTVRPGIRLKDSGKYYATKSIKGQRFYEEFDTLREATNWKNTFRPSLKRVITGKNGINIGDAFERFTLTHVKTLGPVTQSKLITRMAKFLEMINRLSMDELSPDVITRHLEDSKLLVSDNSLRCNFNEEIKILRSFFSWYQDSIDEDFKTPLKKYHKAVGFIKDVPEKEKNIKLPEIVDFLEKLKDIYKDLSLIQFYTGTRIGEVCALRPEYVNFSKKSVLIKEVITWINGIPDSKKETKTRSITSANLGDEALGIIRKRMALMKRGCPYLFHVNGKPLRYSWIIKEYNRALDEAGLYQYRGTHILRYGMGGFSREEGGVDAVIATIRHKSIKMAEKYGAPDSVSLGAKIINLAEEKIRAVRASNCVLNEKDVV